MTSEGLGEMFQGDSSVTCAGKLSLMLMGAQAEGLACADPGERTPIGVSGNYVLVVVLLLMCMRVVSSKFRGVLKVLVRYVVPDQVRQVGAVTV